MERCILGVDLDGVCADYVQGLREFTANHLGVDAELIPDPRNYSFFTSGWGFTSEEHFRQVHGLAVEDGLYERLEMIPGARETLWELSELGYEIDVITSRFVNSGQHRKVVSQTVNWLDRVNIPFRDLAFLGDKTRHIVDVMVDDSPHNVESLRALDRDVIVFTAPYNHGIAGPRVDNWVEYKEHILSHYPLG